MASDWDDLLFGDKGGKSKKTDSSSSNDWDSLLFGGGDSSGTAAAPADKPKDKGKGLFDVGPIGAVRDVFSSTGNLVIEALDKLDMPRAAIVAGAQELGDGLDILLGTEEIQGGGKLVDTGFNWDDFKTNFNNRVGVGDVIEAAHPDMPHALKVGLGFAGDILTDPLTYVTFGATTAANKGLSGSRLVFADEAANKILSLPDDVARNLGGREGLQKVADDVLAKGTGMLSEHPQTAKAIGLDGVGFNFRGHTIPGTERLAAPISKTWGGAKHAIKERTWNKLSPEVKALWERTPGYSRVVKATGSQAKGLQWVNSSRNATRVARDWGTDKAESFTALHAKHADADWTEVRRLIEDGDLGRAGRSTPERAAAKEVVDWLEQVRTEFNKITGKEMPALQNYFPRQLTPEAIDRLMSASKRAGRGQASALEARVLREGEDFLGVRLEKGTIEEIREISEAVLGDARIELFLDDPKAIFDGYVKGLAREMRRARFARNLEDVGLLEYIDDVGLKAQRRANEQAYGEIKRQSRRQRKAVKKADKAGAKATAARQTLAEGEQAAEDRVRTVKETIELDKRLDEETALVDRTNQELAQLADEGVDELDDTAARQATVEREALEAQAAKQADDVAAAQAQLDGIDAPDVSQLEAELAAAKQAAEQQVDEAVQEVTEAATPAELAAAQERLADAEKVLKQASQDVADLKQTAKGKSGKRTQARDVEVAEDAVMDVADDFDDFGDIVAQGPAAKAAAAKIRNKKRVKKLTEALKGDPKFGTPQVQQQLKKWQKQLDQLADWDKAKAEGAGVPADSYARLEAEAQKIDQILTNMERQFGVAVEADSNLARTAAEQQIVLAEVKKAEAKAARDAAKQEVERLEATISKAGKAGPKSKAVVRKSTTQGNAPSGEVKRLEAALKAARKQGKGVEKAKKDLAAAKRGFTKTQKLVEKARAVEAEEWASLNALKTARQTTATELRQANEELAAKLRKDIKNSKSRQKRLLEKRAALADEAVRLTRRAEKHLAEGDDVLAEVAKQESLRLRHQAEASDAAFRMMDAWDDMPKRLTLEEERQLAEVMAGHLVEVTKYDKLWAEPDIADAFNDFMAISGAGVKRGSFMKAYDLALSRWKAQALLSPGYHIRNFMTAVYMNHLAGMESSAWTSWRHFRKLMKAGTDEAAYEKALQSIPAELRDHFDTAYKMRGSLFGERGVEGIEEIYATGATKSGVLSGSAAAISRKIGRGDAEALRTSSKLRGVDFTSSEFYGYRANFRAAESVERLARGPLFIDGLVKGMSPDEALQRVMKHHFDYSDLSQVERKYMKRVIPFYTWARNNVPVMVEYAARKPGGMMWYLHAQRNMEAVSEEEDVVPGYFEESGAIRTPFNLGGGRFYAAPDLPFLNLNDTFNTSQMLSQVTPAIKAPLEIQAGKKIFNNAPLKDDVSEVPAQWKWLMPLLKATSGVAGLPTVYEQDGRFFMSDKDNYKVEQALPLLGRMRRLLPSEERYQERQFTSVASTIFGFGSFTNGERQQGAELWLREMELNKALKRDKQIQEILQGSK